MGKTTSAERMRALRLRRNEAGPEYKKKESQRIPMLQKTQRASLNEDQLAIKENITD